MMFIDILEEEVRMGFVFKFKEAVAHIAFIYNRFEFRGGALVQPDGLKVGEENIRECGTKE